MSTVLAPPERARGEVRVLPGVRPSASPFERRQQQRFPIAARSRYVLDGVFGYAPTADISSGGVLLRSKQILPAGHQIRVWIDWPALLDQRCPLRLVILGTVLRSDSRGTAVGISRYSFCIRPRSEPPFPA